MTYQEGKCNLSIFCGTKYVTRVIFKPAIIRFFPAPSNTPESKNLSITTEWLLRCEFSYLFQVCCSRKASKRCRILALEEWCCRPFYQGGSLKSEKSQMCSCLKLMASSQCEAEGGKTMTPSLEKSKENHSLTKRAFC